jgi:hypothetical protein
MNEREIADGIQRIRELAHLVIDKLAPISEIEFGFNRASVEWVEGYIEHQRQRLDLKQGEGLANALGSFLGESIAVASGGQWQWNTQQNAWGILLPVGS